MAVRMAVVGVGSMGAAHARVLSSLRGAKLIAVSDVREAVRREVADKHGVEAFSDYRSLEGKVDAVSVAVPTVAHAEVAKFFLDRGVSVLVEKPMAKTSSEARQLVAAARATGARLMIGHIERFNPAFMAIGEMGARPLFIECDRISPFKFRSADVGVVFDLMIHDIDLILSLARSKVVKIDACGVAVLAAHEDICNARIEFESGCVANVTASRISPKSLRKIRIFGRETYITVDTGARKAHIYRKSDKLTADIAQALKTGGASLSSLSGIAFPDLLDVREIKFDDHEPLAKELEAFVASVANGTEPPVTGEAGLEAIIVAERIVEAVKGHGWQI